MQRACNVVVGGFRTTIYSGGTPGHLTDLHAQLSEVREASCDADTNLGRKRKGITRKELTRIEQGLAHHTMERISTNCITLKSDIPWRQGWA